MYSFHDMPKPNIQIAGKLVEDMAVPILQEAVGTPKLKLIVLVPMLQRDPTQLSGASIL
jgi:hypothetical protein